MAKNTKNKQVKHQKEAAAWERIIHITHVLNKYSGIEQCSSTFFIMVHPKKSCDELIHPVLVVMWQNASLKLTCKKTTTLRSAQRITQDRA